MSTAFQIPTQAILPWTETADYVVATKDGDGDTYCLSNAAQYDVDIREGGQSFGVYTTADKIWTVDADQLCEVTPKPRDRIIDEQDLVWTVLRVSLSETLNFYKFLTRNLAIAADLADSLVIRVPAVGQGATAAATRDWSAAPKYNGIPGRAQPLRQDVFEDRGKMAVRTLYTVFLDRQIDPRNAAGDWGRVEVNGLTLRILGYRDAERIDELPKLDCVLEP